ncbi:MAG: alpha-2,8-polysialyltransferase family protein, partial [Odoribacter sp.]|nr:alpha-2,8-polysialyltransferase family protein [Odoribacter sp.]
MGNIVCFACTTPYQIMGAVSIVHHKNYEADIYIFDTFSGCNKVAENLEKEGIFRNVYMIPFYKSIKFGKNQWVNRLMCMLRFVFARGYIQRTLGSIKSYNQFFTSSKAIPKMVLKRAVEGENSEVKTVIYEDGMGTYFPEGHTLKGSSLFQKLENICHFEFAPNGKTTFMPCYPEVAVPPVGLTDFIWGQMPEMDKTDSFRNMMFRIFGCDEAVLKDLNEKCIIFDGYRGEETEFTNKLDQIYDFMAAEFQEDIICKPHPRSNVPIKSKIKLFENTKIPMEVLYMGMKDLQDKVLFSYYSTAVFTPKLLFSEEPYIILLYRILNIDDFTDIDKVVEKFGKIYQKKIMVPDTM